MNNNLSRVDGLWSRRSLLRFAGVAGAAAVLPKSEVLAADAFATAPSADLTPRAPELLGLQGAGFYRFKVGDITAMLVSDGQFLFERPFPLFGQNASKEGVEQALAEVSVHYDHTLAQVNALVLKIGDEYVLVDAGCGEAFGPTTGFVRKNLSSAAVPVEHIKHVILTHAHADHFSGLLRADGSLAYPNAKYYVSPIEAAFWNGEKPDFSKSGVPVEAQAGFIEGARKALAAIKPKSVDVADGQEILPGVKAVALPGHTPGQIGLMITSGTEKLFYITDIVHQFGISMQHPDWFMGFDTDRELGAKTRRATLSLAAESKLLVSGSHLPFPGVGHVHRAGDAFRWQPVMWEW